MKKIAIFLLLGVLLGSGNIALAKKGEDISAYEDAESRAKELEKERDQYKSQLLDSAGAEERMTAEEEVRTFLKDSVKAMQEKKEVVEITEKDKKALKCDGRIYLQELNLDQETSGFEPVPFEKSLIHNSLVETLNNFFEREVTLVSKGMLAHNQGACLNAIVVKPEIALYQKLSKAVLRMAEARVVFKFQTGIGSVPDFEITIHETGAPHLGATTPAVYAEKVMKKISNRLGEELAKIEDAYGRNELVCRKKFFMKQMDFTNKLVDIRLDYFQELQLNSILVDALEKAFSEESEVVRADVVMAADPCKTLMMEADVQEYVVNSAALKKVINAKVVFSFFHGTKNEKARLELPIQVQMKMGAEALGYEGAEKVFEEIGEQLTKELKKSNYRHIGRYI
ncbi:MAG: hypothetical protein GF398_16180 [Chitinivibrionales bacterium]|nr:hypothetical protein [Chitinivibrionales bacterium]